jgi:hypothetical protein
MMEDIFAPNVSAWKAHNQVMRESRREVQDPDDNKVLHEEDQKGNMSSGEVV